MKHPSKINNQILPSNYHGASTSDVQGKVWGWHEGWDPAVGLYRGSEPGHTAALIGQHGVHPGPNNANRLLLAAHCGQLDQLEVATILERLSAMQVRDGSAMHGCPCWYWEEERPVDTNAAFFTGLSLLVLWVRFKDSISPASRELLESYLRALHVYFKAHTGGDLPVFYPNKVLGDLVCAWFLHEQFAKSGEDAPALRLKMLSAADYWTNHGWGWGEHMSDIYARVCLTQLSALLCFSTTLPQDLHTAYTDLFRQLITIEGAFAGGPRVPAIRSYAFKQLRDSHSQKLRTWGFLDTIRPLEADFQPSSLCNLSYLGPLLHAAGWHAWADSLEPWNYTKDANKNSLEVPCFDGKIARALVGLGFRIGSISEYPVMPNCDHFEHGLSWQSMPVALSRPGKNWAYLQWSAGSPERIRSHPAESRTEGGPDNALSKACYPPPVGQTKTWQNGGVVLAFRRMPIRATEWSMLSDRLRMVGECGERGPVVEDSGWWRARMVWEDVALDLATYPLTFKSTAPQWQADGEILDFGWRLEPDALQILGHAPFASLWVLRFGVLDAIGDTNFFLPTVEQDFSAPSYAGMQAWRISFSDESAFSGSKFTISTS